MLTFSLMSVAVDISGSFSGGYENYFLLVCDIM